MPRCLTLVLHLPVTELETRYRAARDPVARTHWHLLWLVGQGQRCPAVARLLGYSVDWVRTIVNRYNTGGPQAVGDHRHGNPGRRDRALLTPAMRAELVQALTGPAPDGGVWSGPKVAAWMSARLGRPVHVQRGWEALRAVGFTPQRPRPRATRADPVAQAAFKKGASRPRSTPSGPPIPTPR